MTTPPTKTTAANRFQPPRGTRDFYPIEMARRLWLEDKWRRTAVRHGFDEIDGPTFEHLDLYTVKSGEGIVSELFSFTRAGGETPFALRPEFTPTLARMVAEKANALPKPIRWFSIGPYFRAERPQRGRLREFLQWNVDVLGDPSPEADAEAIACCVASLEALGLTPKDVRVRVADRKLIADLLTQANVPESQHLDVFALLDAAKKIDPEEFNSRASSLGIPGPLRFWFGSEMFFSTQTEADAFSKSADEYVKQAFDVLPRMEPLRDATTACGVDPQWVDLTVGIVRGLAYYTGTVFEVHETTGAERAIAGGGRYDNLVELFGGPPTPAVGFAMGDVVISLVLQDKGLMPTDDQIARDLGLTPDAFVVAANDDAEASLLRPVLSGLRRAGLHARRSYRTTRNIGKLLQEADKAGARYAVILESPHKAQVKNLHTKEQREIVVPATDLAADAASLVKAIADAVEPVGF